MTPPLLYIAGPYRASTPWLVAQNIRAAEALGLHIARYGAFPVIPHSMYAHFDKALPDRFFLDATLEIMRRCDGVVLLPTWESSTGAKAEASEAIRLGMPVWVADETYRTQPHQLYHGKRLIEWLRERGL